MPLYEEPTTRGEFTVVVPAHDGTKAVIVNVSQPCDEDDADVLLQVGPEDGPFTLAYMSHWNAAKLCAALAQYLATPRYEDLYPNLPNVNDIVLVEEQCKKCHGTGVVMQPLNIKCDACNGTGRR